MNLRFLRLCMLLAAASAWAGDELPASLDACLDLGLRAHPNLRAARLALDAADAAVGEARAAQLPALVLSGSATRFSDEDTGTLATPFGPVALAPWIQDRFSMGASLRQNLFSGFAVRSRIQAAAAAKEAARRDLAAETGRIAYEIEAAWWGLAAAVEARGVVEESRRLLRVHVSETEQFLSQGLATREELLRVQSELAAAELRVTEAASTERLARSRLALMVGLGRDASGGPTSVPAVPDPAAAVERLGPLDSLVAGALGDRAELAAMDERIRAASAAATGARSGFFPSVSLDGALVWARPNPLLFPPQDRFDATWQIGVSASVNVGGYGAVERRVRGAELEKERLAAQRDGRATQVTLEVAESYETVRRAAERIVSARAAAARSDEALRVVRDKRAAGLARATDLLDAELDLMRARLDGSRAAMDLRVGLAALRRAVGGGPPAPATEAAR